MSIEIQCMTEKLIVITIKLDYSKVPSKSTVPTYANNNILLATVTSKIQDGSLFSWGLYVLSL